MTKEFLEVLEAEEASIREQIGGGALITETAETMGVMYSRNIGKAEGVQSASRVEDRFYDHERVLIDDEDET